MNTDIRLSVGFWQHPKVFRLEKQLGLKAIRSLQILWCWCAQNRPDGNLTELDAEDIEFVADWHGKKGAFVKACEGSWLDITEDGYRLHEWKEYNPWQAQAGSREEARKEKARKAANARWQKSCPDNASSCSNDATSNAQAMLKQCSNDATSNAQAMPTSTSTSTSTNIIPPYPPGGQEGDSASPDSNADEKPPVEFLELRELFDTEMRPEGPMAGWKEYKQAKSAGYWPGISRIVQDIEERKKACVWNPGYEIGLGRYLSERTWLGEIRARASPAHAEPQYAPKPANW